MTTELQTRSLEIRSEITGNRITGLAVVFDQVTNIGPFYEVIKPSALDRVLADPATDIRAFLDHDSGKLIGRQSSGTLRLSTDARGLHYEIDLPDTSAGRDARTLIERGDLTGVSFKFTPGDYTWSTYEGRDLWIHNSFAYVEHISPVSIPAYEGTSVALRSKPTTAIDGRTQILCAKSRTLRKEHN